MKPVLGPPCRPCCLPLQVSLLRAGTDTTNTREQSRQAKRGQPLKEGDIQAWPWSMTSAGMFMHASFHSSNIYGAFAQAQELCYVNLKLGFTSVQFLPFKRLFPVLLYFMCKLYWYRMGKSTQGGTQVLCPPREYLWLCIGKNSSKSQS